MKKIYILPVLCMILFAGGCNFNSKGGIATTLDGFTQGTYYHIVYISRDSIDLQESIDSLLTAIDYSMSIFNPESRLSLINSSQTDLLDDYITYCINTAREVSEMSDGRYDITVKPLVEAWGFATREYEERPNIDSLLQFVGYKKISIDGNHLIKSDPRVQIDLNSIAKGYTADLVGQLIESHGIKRYMVEIGGEVVTKGKNVSGTPWTIGIEKPMDGNYIVGEQMQIVLSLTDKSIATSGNYRNFYYDECGHKIVHSINPITGSSEPSDLLSVTIVDKTCARADAIATAMIVSGKERALEMLKAHPDILAYLIYVDEKGEKRTYISPELQKRVIEVK